MKQKMNAELDLVSKKLNEEAREKRVQMSLEINEKNMVSKILCNDFDMFSVKNSPTVCLPRDY